MRINTRDNLKYWNLISTFINKQESNIVETF